MERRMEISVQLGFWNSHNGFTAAVRCNERSELLRFCGRYTFETLFLHAFAVSCFA